MLCEVRISPPHPLTHARSTERVLLAAVIALTVLTSFDASRSIPPVGDDLYMIEYAPGALFTMVMHVYGVAARPVGTALQDVLNSIGHVMHVPLLVLVVAMRCVTLSWLYRILRRGFHFSSSQALFATALGALTPPAVEGWAHLGDVPNMLSIATALAASSAYVAWLYAGDGEPATPTWRQLATAAALQLIALALYE